MHPVGGTNKRHTCLKKEELILKTETDFENVKEMRFLNEYDAFVRPIAPQGLKRTMPKPWVSLISLTHLADKPRIIFSHEYNRIPCMLS